VLESQNPWSASDVEAAIDQAQAPHLTAGTMGIEWKQMEEKQTYFKLVGIAPLAFAIDGRYCLISDDAGMLSAMMQKASELKLEPGEALVMLSGFNHEAERATFARATHLVDGATATANADASDDGSGQTPQFFSRNIASLSHAFAAMRTEEVSAYWKSGAMHETVRYEWK
jgi:hypothetical protein